jgi:hypothetical protein
MRRNVTEQRNAVKHFFEGGTRKGENRRARKKQKRRKQQLLIEAEAATAAAAESSKYQSSRRGYAEPRSEFRGVINAGTCAGSEKHFF